MRRILIVFAGFAVVSIAAESMLSGQTQSTQLTVTANVVKNCTITTTPVAFGSYDPVTANKASALDGIGTVSVTCTKGAVAKVGLNTGSYPSGGRRMFAGGEAFLNYELYRDQTRATVWGDTLGNAVDVPASPSALQPQVLTVYGRVPQAQDATVGNYADTVVATVNF